MFHLKRKALINSAAVAIPVGIAAAFACATPAIAAPEATKHLAAATRPLTSGRQQARLVPAGHPGTSQRRPARHQEARRLRAYEWAHTQAGHPYQWGGTGPGYDCSGLVMMAYRHAGVQLPRTTTQMLASWLLIRVRHPQMGDLAFYGSGHVELFRRWGFTFGAHDFGTPVSLVRYGWGWKPTAFYRVR